MVEWLAGHGVTEVVLACGFLPDVLREALGGEEERAGVRIRYVAEPEPLRHRRGDPLRRRRARRRSRRPLPRAQRRRPHRPRPERPAARPRGARGAGDDRPCTRSRTPPPTASSAATRRRAVLEFLEKTGERGPRRDQRRRLRARALGARPDPAGRERLDRARRLPAAGRRRALRGCRSTATGWTSAPPSATCRRAGTSSRARVDTAGRADRSGPASSPPPPRSPPAPTVGPRAVVSAPAAGSAPAPRSRGSVLLDGCAVGEGARVVGSILAPGAEVGAGASARRRGRRPG